MWRKKLNKLWETFYKNTNTKHIKNSFSTVVRGNRFSPSVILVGGLYTLMTLNLLKCECQFCYVAEKTGHSPTMIKNSWQQTKTHIFFSILKGTQVAKIYTNKFYFFLILTEIGRSSALTCLELNRSYCREVSLYERES